MFLYFPYILAIYSRTEIGLAPEGTNPTDSAHRGVEPQRVLSVRLIAHLTVVGRPIVGLLLLLIVDILARQGIVNIEAAVILQLVEVGL